MTESRVLFGADGATVIFDDADPTTRRVLSGADIVALLEENVELQKSFDLRWKADMRAIKRWREAHPGKENIWPDHADLVVWLLEQLDASDRLQLKVMLSLRDPAGVILAGDIEGLYGRMPVKLQKLVRKIDRGEHDAKKG